MNSDIDIRKFYQATNPTQTLSVDSSEEDRKYYIDFSSVQECFDKIDEVFDVPETLDRLCLFSGGHVRQLLRLLNQSIGSRNEIAHFSPEFRQGNRSYALTNKQYCA